MEARQVDAAEDSAQGQIRAESIHDVPLSCLWIRAF